MPSVPTAERPPSGLTAYWTGAWRRALRTLKDQGTWALEQKPLLDEYIHALHAAESSRNGFAWLDHLKEAVASEEIDWISLRTIATGLPTQWDRHTKRAAALADQLALTPRGRKAINADGEKGGGEKPADPLAGMDELAAKRASVGA